MLHPILYHCCGIVHILAEDIAVLLTDIENIAVLLHIVPDEDVVVLHPGLVHVGAAVQLPIAGVPQIFCCLLVFSPCVVVLSLLDLAGCCSHWVANILLLAFLSRYIIPLRLWVWVPG